MTIHNHKEHNYMYDSDLSRHIERERDTDTCHYHTVRVSLINIVIARP